ncbi:Ig-like domain-containing protein [Salinibacterium soli]|uniref:Ig-like domain-containing protein n=1 Tax=Antiquaquibacter soli TaxID=3064523 RepID=A0ABT9BSR1_9MICO|nr:Ig-like domain-containing protein [Protaetiibacter sp. WY-16]MDO7882836.1 Ig-like domain-containing protein [Protaetiibacter sp. WY-16]
MPAPLESPARRFRPVAITPDPLRIGAMILVIILTIGFSLWAVLPAFADDPVDLPPVAADDYFSGTEDSVITGSVCGNDSDPEAGDLDAVGWGTPSAGGQLDYNGSSCEFWYYPPAGFSGVSTFTYFAHDHVQSSIAPATVTVEVTPVDDPAPVNTAPVAVDDYYSTPAGETLTAPVSILANDTDAEGDALVVDWNSGPPSGLLTLDSGTGLFTYVPAAGYSGPVTFTYYVYDGTDTSNYATVTITVIDDDPDVNHVPVAVADAYVTGKNQKLVIPAPGVVVNDTDADGDPLMFSLTAPVGGKLPGEMLLNDLDGTMYYTPPTDFTGTRTWSSRAWDGIDYSAPVDLVIEVTEEPVDYAEPVAVDDEYSVVTGTTLSVPAPGILGNDSDADSGFSLTSYIVPDHGAITSMSPLTGAFEYVPAAGFVGDDSFTYVAVDPQGGESNSATVIIHVLAEVPAPEAGAPVAMDDAYTVAEGGTLSVSSLLGVLVNDSDPDGDLLSVSGTNDLSDGTLSVDPSGGFDYTPSAGFTGDATFEYRVTDGSNLSEWATVTITVTPAESAPELPTQPDGPGDAPSGASDGSPTGTGAAGLASTGSSVSALAAFSALLLVAIGAVVMRRGRARSGVR